MMKTRRNLSLLLAFVLSLVTAVTPLVPRTAAYRNTPVQSAPAPDLTAGLAAIEKAVDARRQELGIPGVDLAIVKDDKVVYIKGLGFRDLDRKLPVTPDTLFAIGSSSKAFTAMAAMMTVDEGKLSLEDSPKKYLPYFKLRDEDADAKITI